MPVRSLKAWGPVLVPTTDPTLVYTVPAGKTLLLKAWVAYDPATTVNSSEAIWLATATGTGTRFSRVSIIGGEMRENWPAFLAFPGGTTLYAHSAVARPALRVWGFGALLDGVAA